MTHVQPRTPHIRREDQAMPGRKSTGPSVKDEKMYESLRDEGASKLKAARVSNAT